MPPKNCIAIFDTLPAFIYIIFLNTFLYIYNSSKDCYAERECLAFDPFSIAMFGFVIDHNTEISTLVLLDIKVL